MQMEQMPFIVSIRFLMAKKNEFKFVRLELKMLFSPHSVPDRLHTDLRHL